MCVTKTLSRCNDVNIVVGRVLTMTQPPSWSKRCLLLRVLTRDSTEIMFTFSGACIARCEEVKAGLCYTFHVPGSCVKPNKERVKHGVPGDVAVYAVCMMLIERNYEAWPVRVKYTPTLLANIYQQPVGAWVDIVARAAGPPGELHTVRWCWRDLELVVDGHAVVMQLTGDNVNLQVKQNDLVAVRGARVREMYGTRKLVTAPLTYIEINPVLPENQHIEMADVSAPRKKARRVTRHKTCTLADLAGKMKQLDGDMQRSIEGGARMAPTTVFFCTSAWVKPFTEDIFDQTNNLLYHDSAGELAMMVNACLCDNGTEIPVTLHGEATREIFQMDAGTFKGLWEDCDSQEGQTNLVALLNANLRIKYVLQGDIKLWVSISKTQKRVDININAAEQPRD